ncbi:MAG: serine/threonine protein kinase with repeat, partial [Bryobacterales bacterium]|nr:serine/threonine protein kinase with repeat [Bryobacterales bacterium]
AGRRKPGRRWIVASIAAAAALAAGLLALPRVGLWKTSPVAATSQHIAVLTFNVLGQDQDLTVFADGLMEGITSRLSQFEGPNSRLMVVPASVVRQQAAKTPADARRKLGVDAVVEGHLQGQGDRVRLMLNLVDTRQMRQTDSVVVEDKRSNALSLQDAAVEKLANALSLRVRPEHAASVDIAPPAPGAYEYYLQARGYLQRSDKLPSIESAIALFNRTLELDNRSAIALAGLGEAYQAKFNLTRDSRWIDEALKSCRRALELNPSLPEAKIIMGRIHLDTGQYEQAQKDFETALQSDQRNSAAYQGLASAYEDLKQFDKAEATYRKGIALRPEDWNGYRQLGLFYYRRGNFDKAIDQYQKVVALTPDNAQGYTNLGAFQIRKGANEEAKRSLLRALELDPNRVSTLTNLAKLYFDQEQYPKAIELYERAVKLNASDYRMPGSLGVAYKRMGDSAKAAAPLESAIKMVNSELKTNPKKAELYSYLAFYQATLGRRDGVEALLQRAMGMSPDDLDIMIRAAETEATLGNTDRALALLRRVIAKGFPRAKLKDSIPLRHLLPHLDQK